MEQKLTVRAIIEMLGAPKEYIELTLKNYVEKLKQEGLQITSVDCVPAEQKEKFFSVFAELEILFAKPKELLDFCFDSMPSSIEIIEPVNVQMTGAELSDLLNDLQAHLHDTDLYVKNARARQELLDKNAFNVLRNFVKFALRSGPQTCEQLSEVTGINVPELFKILDTMVVQKFVRKKEDLYSNE